MHTLLKSIDMANEYNSLRDELQQSKKYVFERPLLIVAIGVAGLSTQESNLIAALPVLIAGILLFNLWFTVNRLRSSARIVAYIQLVMERNTVIQWIGWETSLRQYRILLQENKDSVEDVVKSNMEGKAIPDSLLYYSAIYNLHIVIIVSCVIGSLSTFFAVPLAISVLSVIITSWIAYKFYKYCVDHTPKIMRQLIERERSIWLSVLQ